MRSFVDTKNRTWEVSITAGGVKRVKGLLGINLYDAVADGPKALGELLGDVVQLVDILYALCEPQAKSLGVSDLEFGEGFAGDVIEDAANAFVEELIDFFPKAKARHSLRKAVATGRQVQLHLLEKLEKKLDALDPASLAESLSASSGNAPASPESIPPGSPSAN